MVLWSLFAVIIFLCGSTSAKKDYDLRRTSSTSMDLIHNDFAPLVGNALNCRYSKLLSVLRENFNLDEEEATSVDKVKVKKNHGSEQAAIHRGGDSFEEDMQDEKTKFQDDDRSGNFLNSFDDFDFLKEVDTKKSTTSPIIGCDCKIKNDLLDLGHLHYPRYLLNAVCQKYDDSFEYPSKCWRGAQCKPLEYKVRVLTHRFHNDHLQKDPAMSLLPDVLRSEWKFKTVTVAAGCFCS